MKQRLRKLQNCYILSIIVFSAFSTVVFANTSQYRRNTITPYIESAIADDYILLRSNIENLLSDPVIGVPFFDLRRLDVYEGLPVNMIEWKPNPRADVPVLFHWNKEKETYEVEVDNMNQFVTFLQKNKLRVQIHLPGGFRCDDGDFLKLDAWNIEDHGKLLELFSFFERIREEYALADELIVTMHPPEFYDFTRVKKYFGLDPSIEEEHLMLTSERNKVKEKALQNMHAFLVLLGNEIEKKKWNIKVGIENLAYSVKGQWKTGNKIEDFEVLLRDTSDAIQITFDAGHSMLSRGDDYSFVFYDILKFTKKNGKYIVNYHFHENDGFPKNSTFDTRSHTADLHRMPMNKMVPGYRKYHLRRCAFEGASGMFELNLTKYDETSIRTLKNVLMETLAKIKQYRNNYLRLIRNQEVLAENGMFPLVESSFVPQNNLFPDEIKSEECKQSLRSA